MSDVVRPVARCGQDGRGRSYAGFLLPSSRKPGKKSCPLPKKIGWAMPGCHHARPEGRHNNKRPARGLGTVILAMWFEMLQEGGQRFLGLDARKLDRNAFLEMPHDLATHVAELDRRAEGRAHLDVDRGAG